MRGPTAKLQRSLKAWGIEVTATDGYGPCPGCGEHVMKLDSDGRAVRCSHSAKGELCNTAVWEGRRPDGIRRGGR